jgi:acyl-CoA thioester hydrolase
MPFVLEVTVQPTDIDNLKHASNLVYLRWVQEAALAHSTAMGMGEQYYLSRGQAWFVRRHEIEYLKPAFAGEALRIETRVASMALATSVRKTRILRGEDLICTAATDWVFVELDRGRPARIPHDVRSRFAVEP